MDESDSPLWVLKCRACGLAFKDAHRDVGEQQVVYSEDYVHFAEGTPPSAADVNSARQKLRRSLKLLGDDGPASDVRILDIGCGVGQFVRILRSIGYAAHGIDPYLPQRLAGPLLRRTLPAEVAAESYDVATMLNVAEHVVDPHALFASVHRLLRPGGVALVTCPYGESWAMKSYRNRWTHATLPEHLLFWSPVSLERCFRRAGFAGTVSLRIAGSPFPYGLAGSAAAPVPAASSAPSPSVVPWAMRLQQRVWRAARYIQSHELAANAVRGLVNAARLGDYLEFAIRRDPPESATP